MLVRKFVPGSVPCAVLLLIVPSTSGFATKKLAGRPALIAFCLNVALLRMPVLAVLLSKLNGSGLRAARNASSVALVQFAPLYAARLPACDAGWPFRYARRIGSGDVPAVPVYAKVARARPQCSPQGWPARS